MGPFHTMPYNQEKPCRDHIREPGLGVSEGELFRDNFFPELGRMNLFLTAEN